jgi:hypothetical protein
MGRWVFDGWCEMAFESKVNYPLEGLLNFTDYLFALTVKSKRDPEVFFN